VTVRLVPAATGVADAAAVYARAADMPRAPLVDVYA
jgi:hypothetical protein